MNTWKFDRSEFWAGGVEPEWIWLKLFIDKSEERSKQKGFRYLASISLLMASSRSPRNVSNPFRLLKMSWDELLKKIWTRLLWSGHRNENVNLLSYPEGQINVLVCFIPCTLTIGWFLAVLKIQTLIWCHFRLGLAARLVKVSSMSHFKAINHWYFRSMPEDPFRS